MRQRNVKDLERKLVELRDYIIEDPFSYKGKWHEVFGNDRAIYLEIGCGKGQFIASHAALNEDANYIGVEGQNNVILRGLEKAKAESLTNVKFVPVFVRNICDLFEDGEVAEIYLNFSDPWPKAKHAKRRLTHSQYLRDYKKVVGQTGLIEIKTDNDGLYEFTLDQIEKAGFEVLESTMDLHNSDYVAKEITTEYEDKFNTAGKNINYIKL